MSEGRTPRRAAAWRRRLRRGVLDQEARNVVEEYVDGQTGLTVIEGGGVLMRLRPGSTAVN